MSPERLRALIDHGETLAVEFKGEERAPLSDRDLVANVVCLSNRPGDEPGWLLIGVEDDGRVTGARPRHAGGHTDPHRVQALIANQTRPSISCRVELVPWEEQIVLAIEVPASRTPVGTTDGTYMRRAIGGRGKPECLPYHFHEMQARAADRGMLDYTALVLPEAGGRIWISWSSSATGGAFGRAAVREMAHSWSCPISSLPKRLARSRQTIR
jgi:ATP-dependent DNA helicase RecG